MRGFSKFTVYGLLLVLLGGLIYVGITYNDRIGSKLESDAIAPLEKRMSSLEEEVSAKAQTDVIDPIKQDLSKLKKEVSSKLAPSDISPLKSRLDDLESKVQNLNSKLDSMEKSLKEDIAKAKMELENELSALKKDVDTLESRASKLVEKVDSLEKIVDAHSDAHDKMWSHIFLLEGADNSFSDELAEIKNQLKKLEEKVQNNSETLNAM